MSTDTDPQGAFGPLYVASASEAPQNHNVPLSGQACGNTADACRVFLEGLPEAVIVMDRNHRIVFVNAQAERMFGYRSPVLYGNDLEIVLPAYGQHGDGELCTTRHVASCPRWERNSRVLMAQHRDGHRFPAEMRTSPVEVYGQLFVTASIRDVPACQQGDEARPQTTPSCHDPSPVTACGFHDIIGQSQAMQHLFHLIEQVADSHATILIEGESGTGKELIARAIHCQSLRRAQPFVAIDCGSLPESLLESELFGHVKGAFTGAIGNTKGVFEMAHGGTLLLDEIGDTSLIFQSKLLRVLQESEIRPVGSHKSLKINVRVIAATNKCLREKVKDKTFREDLYYRLSVVPITVPPLRQRQEDIPLLVDYFIRKYCQRDRFPPKHVSAAARQWLLTYPWPGNVRELEHTIERAILLSPGAEIMPENLWLDQNVAELSLPLPQVTRTTVDRVEMETIAKALQQTRGNRTQAAKLLKISRATLYNKLKCYGLTASS
jgi:PAS domain S-box-containing protein